MTRAALHLTGWAVAALPLIAVQQGAREVPGDPVLELQSRVQSGAVKLEYEPQHGYLKSLLRELKIDPATQTLVFAKNSMQGSFISTETPRALYFNDSVYVGWIPNAPLIEVMSIDPVKGIRFYSFPNVKPTASNAALRFHKETTNCEPCHSRRSFTGTPRLFATSVYAAPSGYPRIFSPEIDVRPSTPIEKRWGGWYVTGSHGKLRHMGNEPAEGTDEAYRIDTNRGANVMKLDDYFDPVGYLTPHSDIVALMVMEQQMHVQNILSATGIAVRQAQASGTSVEEECNELVEALVLAGETKFTSPIAGTSRFSEVWQARGPLYKLDLNQRLSRYACSPLIYSDSFRALPVAAKNYIYRQISEGLGSGTLRPDLTDPEREATLRILRDTIPAFPR